MRCALGSTALGLLAAPGTRGMYHLTIATMNRTKGMEFRAVIAMACDDEDIRSQTRIESV